MGSKQTVWEKIRNKREAGIGNWNWERVHADRTDGRTVGETKIRLLCTVLSGMERDEMRRNGMDD